jgi:hypothetical protein
MKITRRQIRRIVREERRNLQEGGLEPGWDDVSPDAIVDGYYNAINQMVHEEWSAADVDPHESPEEVQYVIQALNNLLADLQAGNF